MSAELIKYRFSADEYHRIGEAGIFPPDARLELIGRGDSHTAEGLVVNVGELLG